MLIDYIIKGYKVFDEEVNFTMQTNNYIKSCKENVFFFNKLNLVKSSIIYGPNNTGKSTFISSISLLKDLVSEKKQIKDVMIDRYNFNYYDEDNDKIIVFEIKFLVDNDIYKYNLSIKYNIGIIEESLKINDEFIFNTTDIEKTKKEIKPIIDIYESYKDKLIVTTLPKDYIKYTQSVKKFFDDIIIFNNNNNNNNFFDESFNNYKLEGIYKFLTESNKKEINKFNKLIGNADISIDEIKLDYKDLNIDEELKVNSVHSKKDKIVTGPSIFIESDGSKRFMRYIAQIIKAFETGKIILIDEIDGSLHTILTRSLLFLFNNENNSNTQLIATSHDLLLLDTENLFRKDQIWFVYKDKERIYLYSLNDIKANEGSRNNIMLSYLKGMFGALPNPKIGDILNEKK